MLSAAPFGSLLTAYGLSRVLPQLGGRIHTMRENVYRVVENAIDTSLRSWD
ncbi:hypothetical protein [Parabacteroides sp. ZJ-118]|uniref:hypothetical protein n=1 Tax=Parabacteroides sp. ZJ-118 TaxID=2709398 RepID=UPI0013EE1045|nr:hypothetical protein [Parabacteroides sp. ZJ-118]